MNPTLKAVLALIFVGVMGFVLARPIIQASGEGLTEASLPAGDAEPSPEDVEPSPEPAEPSPTLEPEPTPEPTPTEEPEEVTGAFRTQPLFDRYPDRCFDELTPGVASRLAVRGTDGVSVSGLDGSGAQDLGDGRLLGFDALGSDLAIEGRRGRVSVYDAVDSEPPAPLENVTQWVQSPTSSCVIALQNGELVAEPTGPGRSVLVREGARSFAFSPDGRKLAVVMKESNASSIWIAKLRGTRMREIFRDDSGTRISIAAWSPKGDTVYITSPGQGLSFVTTSTPSQSGRIAQKVKGLEQCSGRLLGVLGGGIVEITRRGADAVTQSGSGDSAVSCSPDGSFIATIRNGDLLLLNDDGSPIQDLTNDSGFTDVYVDWGARGAGLIVGRVPSGGGDAQVWYLPEGGSVRSTGLTYTPGPFSIDWSASPPTGLPLR